jgi:hypothetical protein
MIEKNMIFDMPKFRKDEPGFDFDIPPVDWTFDIPMKERVIEFKSYRDQYLIDLMPSVVKGARGYLNDLAIGKY